MTSLLALVTRYGIADSFFYEDLGFSGVRVERLLKKIDNLQTDAFLVMDIKGNVLISRGRTHELVDLHSLKKIFLNGLYGYLYDHQLVDLDSNLGDWEIQEEGHPLTQSELKATILDLLKSRFGVYLEPIREMKYYSSRRPARGSDLPGENWHYNNWGFDTLARIHEKIAGEGISTSLEKRIMGPLSIDRVNRYYEVKREGFLYSSFGLKMSALEIAQYGRALLGVQFEGKRLLSQRWIELSTQTYTDLGSLGGFGLLWWTSPEGRHFGETLFSEPIYSGWGYGGQHLIIFPKSQIVIVHLAQVSFGDDLAGVSYSDMAEICRLFLDARLTWVERILWSMKPIWQGWLPTEEIY